ncbi:MAG TPA: helix-turn-helix transcriptional regulator [Gemmatimonadales bacterium]|nr:helix-turn-helix transcriptional regulator [Gemmatimonadales bacterium]
MRMVLAGLLAAIVVGGAVDLLLDAPERWLSPHVVYELLLIGGAVAASVWLWRAWRAAAASAASLEHSLAERIAERDAWRDRARQSLESLGQAVNDQFERWGLTPSEREVALLLLKGHGHKQIAADTGRSERTVRQHAVTVYRKAGLGGRAELAAFFLEDLRLPLG